MNTEETNNEAQQQQPNGATNGKAAVHEESPASPDSPSADEVTRLQAELQELKDKYVRVFAEMENMRRRQERERTDLVKYALENAFKDFLPVLDSFETALPNLPEGQEAESPFHKGMHMVKRQLVDTFKKHGLEALHAAGQPFDPNVHQAIQRVESPDVQAETVGNEFAKGYLLNGRLLRPAMVSVLVPNAT